MRRIQRTGWLTAFAAIALALAACGNGGGNGVENTKALCQDEVDNDGDGYVDCDDQDCTDFKFCATDDVWLDLVGETRSSLPDAVADSHVTAETALAELAGADEAGQDASVEAGGGNAPFVPEPPGGDATHWVSPDGSDDNPGTQDLPWRQLSHAAEVAGPGSVVEVLNGTYQSPVIFAGAKGSAQAPIVFRAVGGGATVDGAGADGSAWDKRDAIYIYESSHIIIHGLSESGASRAGARVSLSDHVTIQGCVFGDNGTWGIFTDFADDLNLLGNECFGSGKEHGIYHSNSGDRALIAGNWCHHNSACGIQINADPSMSAGGDGISSDCVIERNLIHDNNVNGGAGINLASVRNSRIRNNVLFSNLATGIGMWDDGQGSQWGCQDNVVEHNTVVFNPGEGRFCVTVWNGSTGNVIRNNVFLSGARGSISFTEDSLPGLSTDYNLYFSKDGWHLFEDDPKQQKYNFDQFKELGGDANSAKGLPVFVDEAAGDYSLADGSPGKDQGVDSGLTECYDGSPRPEGDGYDMGAYDN